MTDSATLLALVRSVFPSGVIDTADRLGEPVAIVSADVVLSTFAGLRDEPELRFDLLCDLTAVDHLGRQPRFEVVYHLRSLSLGALLRIRVEVPEPACELESVTPLWPAADWLEREVFDLFGIRFRGHPELRRILLQDEFEGHPLRKDYPRQGLQPSARTRRDCGAQGVTQTAANVVGSSQRLVVGGASFDVTLDGERIEALQIGIGHRHRGVEKECESGPWYRALPYTERLCAGSSVFASVGFSLAVERLIGVEMPIRCQWLRVVASELSRIADHLTRCARTCAALGATTASGPALEARDVVGDVLEALCGARMAPNWSRIGGLSRAMSTEVPAFARDALGRVSELLEIVERTSSGSPAFTSRLRDVAVFDREQCVRYAVTGPALRAAGVPFDLRKSSPYLVYDQIDFDIPTGEVGDNYDRFLVCLEEIRQSLRIVHSGFDELVRLGPGAVDIDDPRVRWPAKGLARVGLEEHIHHFHGVTHGPSVPAGQTYVATESAGGELGFYLESDGSERPVRVRCRAPSFQNLQSLPQMLRGSPLAELVSTHALQHVVASECER